MHKTLIDREQSKYDEMWTLNAYHQHSPGEKLVDLFCELAQPGEQATILDAGCGAGKGAFALAKHGLLPCMVDISSAGLENTEGLVTDIPFVQAPLWSDLRQVAYAYHGKDHFDYVYCCDVLEHVDPTFTMLVIHRLLEVAQKSVFLSISTVPDQFGVWIGQALHLTVLPHRTWRQNIGAIASIIECRDMLTSSVFLIEKR
jgi:2-polyprenyl-3-methyl-5-hydroxy-6-metoxy-1,4-benzoquinol methylase